MDESEGNSYSPIFVKVCLQIHDFEKVEEKNGFAFFRKENHPPVMVDVSGSIGEDEIVEIANQARIPSQMFINSVKACKILSKTRPSLFQDDP